MVSERADKLRGVGGWRTVFDVSTTVVMIALGMAVVWLAWKRPSGAQAAPPSKSIAVPRQPIPMAETRTLGRSTAKIAMVEYSDFQCPFCGVFARDTLPALIHEYVDTGRVQLAFKNLPLPIHSLAPGAASAATCAGEQGKFWKMHDALFTDPAKLGDADLRVSAGQIGLDVGRYDKCRTGTASAKLVEVDQAEATAFGITGTPTFVLGTIERDGQVRAIEVMSGAKPVAAFRATLDRAAKGPEGLISREPRLARHMSRTRSDNGSLLLS